jgi:acetate kinase
MRILVANAGSSSLKLRLLEGDDRLAASIDLRAPRGRVEADEIAGVLRPLGTVDAVGHRIVHGGTEFTRPVRVNDDVVRELRALADLAPLHQTVSLDVLAAVTRVLPKVPAVACFDTAFHAEMPDAAATYALPLEWRRKWNLRRYGFHGLSHAYAARRATELMKATIGERRVVTCHLGAGASLAAVVEGRSIDTTMGFTPLEGLVMATRSGSIGLTGTSDMRRVVERAEGGDGPAILGLSVYVHRLRAGIASMSAAMGGLDALVFTGGVGENSAPVRQRAAEGLGFLGVAIDPELNSRPAGDREIGRHDAIVRTFVVMAREDLEIARQVRQVMAAHGVDSGIP